MKLKCTCKHDQQDSLHGKGFRVHNPLNTPKTQLQKYRCSVCGNVRTEK